MIERVILCASGWKEVFMTVLGADHPFLSPFLVLKGRTQHETFFKFNREEMDRFSVAQRHERYPKA